MKTLLDRISDTDNNTVAIRAYDGELTYGELIFRVTELSEWLSSREIKSVVLHAHNSIDWVVVDLACQYQGIILTPIPLYFSEEQVNKTIASVKPDMVFTGSELHNGTKKTCTTVKINAFHLTVSSELRAPFGTTKITFTSGSTGEPKGVCLSESNQLVVAESLLDVIDINAPRHLCLLPLPTLLENIAGVYAPLLAGGTVLLPSDDMRGFSGSKLSSPEKLLKCISINQPNTLILVPELLSVLTQACAAGWSAPTSLKFIAVGGSKVSKTLILRARKAGLPVYQGYGLSECASVVSLCSANEQSASCGKILPHLKVDIINSEITVTGNSFLGYLDNEDTWGVSRVYTGDTGYILDGRLFIDGRIKNTIINSFGRNISPEWIESELLATGLFMQAVVIGDAKPFCTALLFPISPTCTREQLQGAVNRVNNALPDYAQIYHPIFLDSPMTTAANLYTENMRPKRVVIQQHFDEAISQIYSNA